MRRITQRIMEKRIVASIIAASQKELEERIEKVAPHVSAIQLDVMDGVFVSNHSLDFDLTVPSISCTYEAHLMIQDPKRWIELYAEKVDMILAHIESCDDPSKIIELAKNKGKKIGFACNPETPISSVSPYLDIIDQVLVMTVQPGFYGSPFLPETLDKVREIRALHPTLDLEVDGGISPDTIRKAADAGATRFAVGSYLIQAENVQKAVASLQRALQ